VIPAFKDIKTSRWCNMVKLAVFLVKPFTLHTYILHVPAVQLPIIQLPTYMSCNALHSNIYTERPISILPSRIKP
jgi:hypothetical protein